MNKYDMKNPTDGMARIIDPDGVMFYQDTEGTFKTQEDIVNRSKIKPICLYCVDFEGGRIDYGFCKKHERNVHPAGLVTCFTAPEFQEGLFREYKTAT